VWRKLILTALAILGHFDAAIDLRWKNRCREETSSMRPLRGSKQAQGTVDVRLRLLRGIESWIDERATQARSSPRSIDL
jgi:hypothetical protein